MVNRDGGALAVTLRCKVAVCGDAAVGKSALCKMYESGGGNFLRQYQMTSGVDVVVAPVRIPSPSGPPPGGVPPPTVTVELFLFDTSGQPLYKERCIRYWESVSLGIVCYDCSNRRSFESVPRWVAALKDLRRAQGAGQIPVALVATKCDLQGFGCVSGEEGNALAQQLGMTFFETSSSTPGKGVEAPFEHVAKTFADSYDTRLGEVRGAVPS